MNVSMRSYLTAGTVAVMGASAIALTPVTLQSAPAPSVQLPTISTEVTLAGIQDDLYNFLIDYNDARALEPMLGGGWFLIDNPVGQ